MTRNRSTSPAGLSSLPRPVGYPRKGSRPLLLFVLLLALGSCPMTWAQGTAENAPPVATTDSTTMATAPAPAIGWNTVWAVLGGVVIGALGTWLWARRSAKPEASARLPTDAVPEIPVEPVRKSLGTADAGPAASGPPVAPATPQSSVAPASTPADGPAQKVTAQSLREVQGMSKLAGKSSAASNKKNKPNINSRNSAAKSSEVWPQVPYRAPAMNPNMLPMPPIGDNQPLEPGQTIEWAAPTSTPPAIQELIDASAPLGASAFEAVPLASVALAVGNGPVHYYAPAPDVPSIEHRKLSPNPLPQMPVLITLLHAEATTAQFSFSPQADQSRIIGNGVRELKEFFQFELPPTEQFTAIKNLMPGKLEKRDDTWHVVQKAEIALS